MLFFKEISFEVDRWTDLAERWIIEFVFVVKSMIWSEVWLFKGVRIQQKNHSSRNQQNKIWNENHFSFSFAFSLRQLYFKAFPLSNLNLFSITLQLNPSYLLLQNQNFFCTVFCFSLSWAHTFSPTHIGYCEGRLILHHCTPTITMIWQLFLYLSSIRLLNQLPLRSKYQPSIHTSPHTLLQDYSTCWYKITSMLWPKGSWKIVPLLFTN
jgi:hypothetical protein